METNLKFNYIAIDGPDGIGKTTFLEAFSKRLKEETNIKFNNIREPGITNAGKILRSYLLEEERSLETQLDILVADRILGHKLVIEPAIKNNELVISDRSIVSSLVYQGLMHNNISYVYEKHGLKDCLKNLEREYKVSYALDSNVPETNTNIEIKDYGIVLPDLVIIGKAPVEVCIQRINNRNSSLDNYLDRKEEMFHAMVHKYFNRIDYWYYGNLLYIDFNKPVEDIVSDVMSKVIFNKGDQSVISS